MTYLKVLTVMIKYHKNILGKQTFIPFMESSSLIPIHISAYA